MSKHVLRMKYHPAKKEVSFQRLVSGQEVVIRNDSILMKHMNSRGKFVLQDHGNSFFADIADAFDAEEAVHIEVFTTKIDYEDFAQMLEYYNETTAIKITASLLSELPDMDEAYRVVKDHGEKSIAVLKKHRTNFFNIPLDNASVKKCVEMFACEIVKEENSIRSKIDSMTDNLVDLCFAGVYSAGKSALINAVLGYQILPEHIESKTARMFKIQSPKPGENVRIAFSIMNYFAELVWNDKSGSFDFAAGPHENPTRKAIQDIINKNKSEKQHRQMYKILDALNLEGDVSTDITIYFPIPLDNERVQFAIYDTPGTDSNYGQHQAVLQDALSNQTHSILVFVAAPTKLEGEGNNALLSYLKEAEKKDSKTSIDIGRSLFVINWADSISLDSRKDLQNEKIKDKSDENFSIKLADKKLFFTSAKIAYTAKAKRNAIQTEEEEHFIEEKTNSVRNAKFGRYFQQNKCATSEYATNKIIEASTLALEKAEAEGDILSALFVCSGVYALENEIVLYGKKFAAAVRAFAIIDSVDKALSKMNNSAKSLEIKNQDDISKINNEIETIRNVIISSIKEAYSKHDIPKEATLPPDILKDLHLDSEYIHNAIADKTLSFIDKLLSGWFFGWGKVKAKEEHKKEITQKITSILDDYIHDFLKNRRKLLEGKRDSFLADVKKTIRDNGNISDEAKHFVLEIRPPEVAPANLVEFGKMYDSNKYAEQFWCFQSEYIDKDKFIEDVDNRLADIMKAMENNFKKDFCDTLTSTLSAVESEFVHNTEKYSAVMQGKLADKKAMENLREKITAAARDLIACQDELNTVIWSVKENG